jgi:hypothetical protein
MKSFLITVFALGVLALPGVAFAGDDRADRGEAIRMCREEVAALTGLAPEDVRLDQVRVRGARVRVDLDVWRAGELTNVRCDVSRGETLTIAAITPALQTAAVAQ